MAVVVKTVLGSHFGVGEFTTHFRTYFSGDWDVHWGYDLDFDPWPFAGNFPLAGNSAETRPGTPKRTPRHSTAGTPRPGDSGMGPGLEGRRVGFEGAKIVPV